MCEINIGNPKYTRNTLLRVKGFSTWGERDTIFLCWLLLHLPQATCGTPSANYWSGLGGPWKSTYPFGRRNSTQPTHAACSAQIRLASPSSESRLSRSEAGTQLPAFSQIPKILSPRFRCMTSFTPPGHISLWGFILTHVNDASYPRAREHLRSCLHLTNPCTEPTGSHPNYTKIIIIIIEFSFSFSFFWLSITGSFTRDIG